MKSLKIIPLLDSIPKVSSYSNYGISLEKLFKMNSLKNLIHTLKFKNSFFKHFVHEKNKIIKTEEYDVYEKNDKQRKFDEENAIDIFSLPNSKSEKRLNIKNIKNEKKNKSFFHKKISRLFDTNSLAFKYNPNFNSIYKNIPSVKIISPIYDKKSKNNKFSNTIDISEKDSLKKVKSDKYLNILINNKYNKNIKNENKTHRNDKSTSSKHNIKNKSIDSIEKTSSRFITEIPITQKKLKYEKAITLDKLPNLTNELAKNKLENKEYDEKNSSMDSNNMPENNNNIIPFHYKNRAIDFSKMTKRKSINNKKSLHYPDFGYYDPKYNLVEKRQYDIFFNKKPETDKYRRKQILLKKIMTSYEVETNYQTIDNNKLNNDILYKYKFLK